ncbi:hypothetical protein BGZ63DRAFT_414777 [Mariannaea sp. PMI_226]|nr:hypothetical protein BGZ63DRAFT_414777 [Mariannaea sp. PMI_226]
MPNGNYVDGSFWFYGPNKGAAIFFFIAYAVSTIIHFWQCYRHKYFKITALFFACGCLFSIGYGLRVYGAFGHYSDLVPYILSVCLIAVSPPLLELANYHILGRVLAYVPYLSPVNPDRVLATFGFISLIVELLNGLGASFVSNPEGQNIKTGAVLMKASLSLQLLVIVSFLSLGAYFHYQCAKSGLAGVRNIKHPLTALYISSGLVMARTIYRTIEYFGSEGVDWHQLDDFANISPIIRYESYFLIFEATLMLTNMWMWNILHPHRYLPADATMYLARDGRTEVKGTGWQDKRHFLISLMDPLDVAGMIRGRKRQVDEIQQTEGVSNRGYEMV